MEHNWEKYFDTSSEYWQKIQEIYDENEHFPKKVVAGRNLHHKFPKSFSKKENTEIDNDLDNLVSLPLASHFIVHYYLWKCAKKGYRSSMALAFQYMRKKGIKYADDTTIELLAMDYANIMKDVSTIHSIIGKQVTKSDKWKDSMSKVDHHKAGVKGYKTLQNKYSSDEIININKSKGAHAKGKTYIEIYGAEKAEELLQKRSESTKKRFDAIKNKVLKIQTNLGMNDDIASYKMLYFINRYWEKDPEILDRIEEELKKWHR